MARINNNYNYDPHKFTSLSDYEKEMNKTKEVLKEEKEAISKKVEPLVKPTDIKVEYADKDGIVIVKNRVIEEKDTKELPELEIEEIEAPRLK